MDHPDDYFIYRRLLANLSESERGAMPSGDLIVKTGLFFLGAPYADGTLEKNGPESLTVNLRAFDCFTYVETCLALAGHMHSAPLDWQNFRALLLYIRYRCGILDGYGSRLHYFSDWLHDNVCKGILQDMTPSLGGVHCTKKIHYMTSHADSYPALADMAVRNRVSEAERTLTDLPRYFIPSPVLAEKEGDILDGDIIGIAAAEEGLDVLHAGLAIRRGKILHLLHASQQAGRIIISPESLTEYVGRSQRRTGILVGRMKVS